MQRILLWVLALSPPAVLAQHAFVPNQGQFGTKPLYKADVPGGRILLEEDRVVFVFWEEGSFGHDAFHDHSPLAEVSLPTANEHLHHAHHAHPGQPTHEAPTQRKGHCWVVAFEGANPHPEVQSAQQQSETRYNYFLGNDPARWAEGLYGYAEVRYNELWPGIAFVMQLTDNGLKWNFELAPGADANAIRLRYAGLNGLELAAGGQALTLRTAIQDFEEAIPAAWYTTREGKVSASARYTLHRRGEQPLVGFSLDAPANTHRVIDPTLDFTVFSGSPADNFGFTAAFDGLGNSYGGGNVYAFNQAFCTVVNPGCVPALYPTTPGAFQTAPQGAPGSATYDVAITKFNPDATAVVYATYIGGINNDQPHSLIADSLGNLYILGFTASNDFPTSLNAFQSGFGGGGGDAFIARLDPLGGGFRGTYLGGGGLDGVLENSFFSGNNPLAYYYADNFRSEIILGENGDVFAALTTASSGPSPFPTTLNAFQSTLAGIRDGAIVRLDANLTSLLYGTYFGGTDWDAAYGLRQRGNEIVFTGGTRSGNLPATAGGWRPTYQGGRSDGYVAVLNLGSGQVSQATYVGTAGYDQSFFVNLNDSGEVYLAGHTDGAYPVTVFAPADYVRPNGGQFVSRLTEDLTALEFSTRFGLNDGNPDISLTAFLVDICENIYVAGWGGALAQAVGLFPSAGSSTVGLQVTPDATKAISDLEGDFYLIALAPNADSLAFATFFGDNGNGDHIDGGTSRFDPNGNVYLGICAACALPLGGSGLGTPGVIHPNNASPRCNMAVAKYSFDVLEITQALFDFDIVSTQGCRPFTANFINTSPVTSPTTTYSWNFGLTPGTDTTLATPAPVSFVYDTLGTFPVTLTLEDPNACVIGGSITQPISVLEPTQPIVLGIPDTCTFDYFLSLDSVVPGVAYVWDYGDGSPPDTFTTVPQQPPGPHTYPDTGVYIITVEANPGAPCALIGTAQATVNTIPTAAFTESRGLFCDSTFFFTNGSLDAAAWEWAYTDPTGATVIFDTLDANPSFQFPDTGQYTVRLVANPNNFCTDTFQVSIAVEAKPVANFTFPDTCNLTRTFVALPDGVTAVYEWDLDLGGPLQTGPTATGTYTSGSFHAVRLVADPGEFCTDTALRSFTVPTIADAAFTIDYTNCDSSARFNYSGTAGDFFQWAFGDADTLQGPGLDTVLHTYATQNTYTVRLVVNPDSTCPDTALQTLAVDLAANAAFSVLPDSACDADTFFTTNLSTGAGSYLWTLLALGGLPLDSSTAVNAALYAPSPGAYEVQLSADPTSPCPASALDTVWVIPSIPPSFAFQPNAPCSEAIQFTYTGSPAALAWDLGDGTLQTGSAFLHNYPREGFYNVNLTTNPGGLCPADTVVVVPVGRVLIDPAFRLPPSLCGRTIAPVNNSQGASTYLWDFGDGTTATGFAPAHTYADSGRYTVTLTVEPGTLCDTSVAQEVELLPAPTAAFTAVQPECQGVLALTNESSGASDFIWELGGGAFVGPDLVRYNRNGTYSILLIAVSDSGCRDTFELETFFDTDGLFNWAIPNVFTPNGDGNNDCYQILATPEQCLTDVVIYDRWGSQVFATRSGTACWDGTNANGRPVPEGVYVYRIRGLGGAERVGTVTLIR